MRVCVTTILVGGILLSAPIAIAQQAEPEISPEPKPPEAAGTMLPEVMVDASPEEKASPKKKAKKKVSGQTQATPAKSATAAPASTEESAYAPVDGFVATRSAAGTKTDKSTRADLGNVPTLVPKHLASIFADYTLPSGPLTGFGLGAGVRYIGSTYKDVQGETSA